MNAEAALRSLFRRNPAAIVAAIGDQGTLVPVPASVPDEGHEHFDGRLAMDLIVGEDHIAVIEAWTRAQHEPVVTIQVHLLADRETPATIHMFDVRVEHGVHIIVMEGQNLDMIARSSDERAAIRRGAAHSKRDSAATFLEVDDRTIALLGWPADELIGKSTLDFVHPDDATQAIDTWMLMRSHGRSRSRVRLQHASGRYVWVEVTNEDHLDDPERLCVLTEMVDISEEMAHLEALRDRERDLARLAEALPIGVCHLRPDHVVVYTNAPLVELLGPIGSINDLLACAVPADRSVMQAALDLAFAGLPAQQEIGVLRLGDERRCELTARAMTDGNGVVDGIIVCAADVTDRSRLRAELEHRANHDDLTGCLNRAATASAVESFLRDSRRVTVAFVDLDDFKAINDEVGHAAGDELLRIATNRMRSVIREGDLLGRLGGDEFIVVCSGEEAPEPAELAERLTHALNGDVAVAGLNLELRASVGAAISVDRELGGEALLQRADTAMYAAKRKSRTDYAVA